MGSPGLLTTKPSLLPQRGFGVFSFVLKVKTKAQEKGKGQAWFREHVQILSEPAFQSGGGGA